jgi:hypothetical protein
VEKIFKEAARRSSELKDAARSSSESIESGGDKNEACLRAEDYGYKCHDGGSSCMTAPNRTKSKNSYLKNTLHCLYSFQEAILLEPRTCNPRLYRLLPSSWLSLPPAMHGMSMLIHRINAATTLGTGLIGIYGVAIGVFTIKPPEMDKVAMSIAVVASKGRSTATSTTCQPQASLLADVTFTRTTTATVSCGGQAADVPKVTVTSEASNARLGSGGISFYSDSTRGIIILVS